MSRSVEVAEPNVISQVLIRDCIVLPADTDRKAERAQEMQLSAVETVCLSFKNVLKIDGLHALVGLTKLQLDNNIIESIENLEMLTCLKWLDLSFNNIMKIQGLSALTRLLDLSIYNNRISTLEGLDTLLELEVLSVGNNELKSIDNLMYLRRLPKLRLLNAAGNPVSRDPDYKPYLLAHMKNLRYLDYRLVDDAAVQLAREQYQDEVLDLEEKEKAEVVAAEERKEKIEEEEKLRRANLNGMNTMLTRMFEGDDDLPKCQQFSFWQDIIDEFKEEFTELTSGFMSQVMALYPKKAKEEERYLNARRRALKMYSDTSLTRIRAYKKKKKGVIAALREERDPEVVQQLVSDVDALQDDLLEVELHENEALKQLISHFEGGMGEITASCNDLIGSHFMKVRDLLSAMQEKAQTLALDELEKFAAGQLEDISDDTAAFLSEKELVMSALNSSHDYRNGKVDTQEDELLGNEVKGLKGKSAAFTQEALKHSQFRIVEASRFCDNEREDLNEILQDLTEF